MYVSRLPRLYCTYYTSHKFVTFNKYVLTFKSSIVLFNKYHTNESFHLKRLSYPLGFIKLTKKDVIDHFIKIKNHLPIKVHSPVIII